MVDPHQVLIDNGNSSTKISETPNLPANLIQMNDSDTSKHQNQASILEVNCMVNDQIGSDVNRIYENRQNVYDKLDDGDEIMCGPSSQNCTSSTIQINENNSVTNELTATTVATSFLAAQNGSTSSTLTSNNFARDIETINAVSPTKVCVIVNNKQTKESDDSYSQQTLPSTSSINNNSADDEIKTEEYSAEFQLQNSNIATLDFNQIDATVSASFTSTANKMDSRKVEPLRININRDPIKTKIKLGPPGDRQTVSPKSSSSSSNAGLDECDDIGEMSPENQQSYPKITIKPIVKPPTEMEHHHHNHSAGSHTPSSSSSSQEAIPKLKIKKVDTNNSNSTLTPLLTHSAALNNDDGQGNYQTHLLSESSSSVPK